MIALNLAAFWIYKLRDLYASYMLQYIRCIERTEDTTLRNRGFNRKVRGELSTLYYPAEPVLKEGL